MFRSSVALSLIAIASAAVAGRASVLAQESPSTDSTYILGPEDVIMLAVQKHPEFSGEFLIPSNGVVNLPAVGNVVFAGKTIDGVSSLIGAGLRKRLLKPEFTVSLKIARSRRVYAVGDLRAPGAFDYKPGWRISELVAAAGGLAVTPQTNGVQATSLQMYDCTVSITSPGRLSAKTVNLGEALEGKGGANLPVFPGDVVTVSSVRLLSVYVLGKVASPGLKLIRIDHAGILEVISMAGGTTVDAVSSSVRITHQDGSKDTVNLVPYLFKGTDSVKLPLVKSGDVIVVPESLQKIAVLGMVKTPGVFPLEDGRAVTLADAIALAQGPDTRRARLSRVGLMRVQSGGKGVHFTINFGDYLRKGDAKLNPLLQPGDIVYVPETNSIDWGVILGSLSTFSSIYYNYSVLHP